MSISTRLQILGITARPSVMNCSAAVILLSYVGQGSGQQPSASESGHTLRVMSFNIRYGSARDGENSWPQRRDLVFDVFRRRQPTMVGVQEALHFQLEEIQEALPNFAYVGVGRDDGRQAGEYAAIVYNRKRLSALDHGTFWFADKPEQAGSFTWEAQIPRICTWMRCRDLSSGRSFYLYNVHWDHQSQVSRVKSGELLLKRISMRDFPGDPVIVTGDFNAGEDNLAFAQLLGDAPASLYDTFRRLHPEERSVGTFHGFTGKRGGPKIDAVLASPEWRVISSKIEHFARDGRFPSDHYPVTAALVLP